MKYLAFNVATLAIRSYRIEQWCIQQLFIRRTQGNLMASTTSKTVLILYLTHMNFVLIVLQKQRVD